MASKINIPLTQEIKLNFSLSGESPRDGEISPRFTSQ